MIEKIEINMPPIEPGPSSGQPDSPGALPDNNVDVSVQVNYAFLIDKAMQIPQTDTQLVEQARELLLSGQLDSWESIKAAAASIVDGGI